MPNKRKGARNAYFFFVLEKLPELRQRGLPVTNVADAIPHCSNDWAMLSEEQKEKYAEMARQWKSKKSEVASDKATSHIPECLPVQFEERVTPGRICGKSDQALLETVFYFINIFSHGELPPHCSQRFLPCEIGCIKYSLKDGIIADFHHFIDPGEVPRGFRFHCQAAGDATHRIPISGFEHAAANHIVLSELYSFIQPRWGTWPPVYCKSVDQFRLNWCLKYMTQEAGKVRNLELLSVEDLVVELYYQKLQKEPSKTWVCNILDASMWDYSSNTRCKWHEENDILFCALATCKKIAYCISNSLASMYDIQLTASHVPLHEKNSQNTMNPKMVILDAGRFQKERTQYSRNETVRSLSQGGDATCTDGHPSGVRTTNEISARCGRGIAGLLRNIIK
uniref:Protein maelstrom homolog n=1 Tax=Salvator merianae TaxID=96440 RepID=A0A8D0DGM7_SALMN